MRSTERKTSFSSTIFFNNAIDSPNNVFFFDYTEDEDEDSRILRNDGNKLPMNMASDLNDFGVHQQSSQNHKLYIIVESAHCLLRS